MYATEKVNTRILKTLRTLMDLSQHEVAHRMGISLSNYQQKENGHIDFRAADLNKLSKIIGVPMETFFGNEADMYKTMRREQ